MVQELEQKNYPNMIDWYSEELGYEPKEAAVEEQNIERHKANKTQKV